VIVVLVVCVGVSVSGVLFSVGVCVCVCLCVWPVDLFTIPPQVQRATDTRLDAHVRRAGYGEGRLETLHVEYAERGEEYGILFVFSLLCEYILIEYVRIHVIYKVNQAEYVIHIRVASPQEYVNTYSTCRVERARG